ncbi:hypothetical protein BT96DRAFT_986846 [Gymnopus androsaceus JB14]|uniref:F-box domain-containing protein n=1 Tax=Gymnopus androsaceus JB14 TaxID=1447944 RepID=A0A6A4IB50_9AGAR|nr:hypothetical protein BT96DRAFT_986846 [Gymnopus androsaceus JB14]
MLQHSQNRIEEPIWLEPTELSFLQKKISETEAQVESLQSQMSEAKRAHEAQISDLMRQKDAKLVELASFRNILSPVRRIPVEILSEIFQLTCLPEDGILDSGHDIVLYTYNLSSVCAAWKKVAHATPQLWSKLCVSDRRPLKVTASIEWVEERFNRSGSLPLDVYLSLFREASAQFLGRILEYRHRIRTSDVTGYPDSYTALFNLPRSSFSRLEKVTLSIGHRDELRYHFPNKIEAFLDAPKLQHVQIRRTTSSTLLFKAYVLPMEQLATLSIASLYTIFDPAVHMDTLHACKGLVDLEINLKVYRGLTSNVSILLPALKYLKIDYWPSEEYDDLLCCLTLPLLERLRLIGRRQDIVFENVADFQRRSATSLLSLTLDLFVEDNVELFAQNLTATLGIFSNLQSLQLNRLGPDVNPLLGALTFSEGSQVLLPKLTHLGLQNRKQGTRYPSDLTSMVLSRWWPDDDERATCTGLARLQKVTLRGYCYDEEIACISELSGLEFDYM